jgi:hypothetical protein
VGEAEVAVFQYDFFSDACFFVKQENQRDEIVYLLPPSEGDDIELVTPVIGKHVSRESEVSRIRRSHDKRIHRRKPLASGHHQECKAGKEQVDESFHGLDCQFSDFYLDVNGLRLQRKQKTHTNTTLQAQKNARRTARRVERKTRLEPFFACVCKLANYAKG